ncbi:glycosyltransferase family 4 protein [Ancylomarina sp. 16SWW S1-10-2]|uniref:glycosyltransferase family 4 protein n=1 Tax=Ancylomarina sp. 16SWW S1-10-2 TaxID=2499681 RepID=UPI0012AD5BB3|nr:glycosyltransferase family 4 protein [Ancylomarina sp. 16SWW S1-10-2]MRT91929.1 glycosyltransferase family 1 protein [Ancylomarina sp. 16SWW S1-10-2]
MNILITAPSLNPSLNVSGVASVVKTIIQENKNHCYYHYLLGRPDKAMNKVFWLVQLVKQLVFFPFLLKLNKIDMVHQNLPFDPKGVLRESIINFWCRLLDIPVVLHVHGGVFMTQGTKSTFFQKLSRTLFQKASCVIVLSEIEREVLKEKFSYLNATVLPNSIDSSVYKSDRSIQKKDKPNLLYLGRIEKNKGINELIEALKKLKQAFVFRFVLCGTGPLVEHVTRECSSFLGHDFEYKGIVSGEAKINIIKESNIFLLPSYFEGLPMALLETMAAGVVPIVTNVGSMQYIIEHGTNGLHVEKQNSDDLYEKLISVLQAPKLCETLSFNAAKTVAEHYDVSNYVIKLNEIYDSVFA